MPAPKGRWRFSASRPAFWQKPNFEFENVRIWIETPNRVFGEYDAQGHVVATGNPYKQTYAGLTAAEHGKTKLLHGALDTLARRPRSSPMESDARPTQKTTGQRFSSAVIQTRTYSGQLRRITRSSLSQSRR
jgi:hypothetical protein